MHIFWLPDWRPVNRGVSLPYLILMAKSKEGRGKLELADKNVDMCLVDKANNF